MPNESENQNELNWNSMEQEYATKMREDRSKASLAFKLNALKKYQAMAFKLKKEIGDFSITLFFLAFLFAGFKDLLDIFSVQLFSWLDWIIDLGFGAVLFFGLGKGSLQQVKEIRMIVIATSVAEVIPLIGAFPCWTASLFLLYIKTSQENSAKARELEEILKKIAKLKNEIAQMK